MNAMERDEIFAILRDAYDGKTEKEFGNGIIRSYESKFGIIAGVTPAIELYTEGSTALGERFLRFRIPIDLDLKSTRALMKRAMLNTSNEDIMRAELSAVANEALNYAFTKRPEVPDKIADKILGLAQWVAIMRGTIIRDRFTKEITHKPFMEIGTRLAKQFVKLLLGIGMFRHIQKLTLDEYAIIKNIALATAPSRLEEIVRWMCKRNKLSTYSPSEVSEAIGLPTETSKRMLENLAMLGVLRKTRISGIKTEWYMDETFLEIIQLTEIYQ